MIFKQETLNLSPYITLYDLIIPKKTCSVYLKSTTHKEHADFHETKAFKKLDKNRYKIKAKTS